ncbi:MAG: transglutaminase-like cysteine peptidase [Sphingomicrobium sp.]
MIKAAQIAGKCIGLLSASLLACAAMPAHAAEFGKAYSSFAKTDAILGGSSALAQILASQGGRPAAPAQLSPASRGTAAIVAPRWSPVHTMVRNDMPDVFGSVALRVGRTSLDKRWRNVETSGVTGAPARFARSLADADETSRLDAINRYVNRRVTFSDDIRQFGRADLWLTASATLDGGKGDCEDYAIAKMQMLRKAGIADKDLYLVIVKDLVRRSDHAVLVVRSEGRLKLLDNGTDEIRDAELGSDYRPVLTFAASGTWTHGYRKAPETFQIASADIRPVLPAAGERAD